MLSHRCHIRSKRLGSYLRCSQHHTLGRYSHLYTSFDSGTAQSTSFCFFPLFFFSFFSAYLCSFSALCASISSMKLSDVIASPSRWTLNLFRWPGAGFILSTWEVFNELQFNFWSCSHLMSTACALEHAASFPWRVCIIVSATGSCPWQSDRFDHMLPPKRD